jgi:hypothetical protein
MMRTEEKKSHGLAEGQRVHYLANLGGLVTISGLEHVEPNLLLGALCEVEKRLNQISSTRLAELKQLGQTKLAARSAEKRSFKSWQRAQQTERFDLTLSQMKKLIVLVGGNLPALEKDVGSELRRILRGALDGN